VYFVAADFIQRVWSVGFLLVGDGETDWFRDDVEFLLEFAGVFHAGPAQVDGFFFDQHGPVDAPVVSHHEVDQTGFVFGFGGHSS
jgi:hypothetical protein